ncbi:MAG: type II secretion system F family protein [Candidatus Jorgensenbacteria bacterium]|nr:type II secretion system F family protein [Candidatus Jorgensenbacteria bacterium]
MKFRYVASQEDGRIIENEVNAKDVNEVLLLLSKNGLRPVSVRPTESAMRRSIFSGTVTITDQIFLSKYMTLMLKIGTGLMEAVNILIADFNKPAVKNILLEIRSSLEQGNPFYTTFARHPKVFSQVYTNLIRAGEASGNLENVFDNLTGMLTRQKELHDQIKGALIYPALLFVGSVTILVFLVMFALPKIANVFLQGGFEPPLFSKIVFTAGLFLSDHSILIFGTLAVVIGFITYLYKSSMAFKRFITSVVDEIPVIRDIVRKIAVQRFASVLSSLIRAGMPITEAIEITANAVGNVDLKIALMRISREGLAKGLTIGEAFKREPYFPQAVTNLVAISERAGHLEEVLSTLADFYMKEIDGSVKSLVSFLEPVLLLFIGVVIGVIALAIIIPIYQLTTQF